MNVYVAGSTKDVERVNAVQSLVREVGHQITFDWTSKEGEIRSDGDWDQHPIQGARISLLEIQACQEADLTIVLCPEKGLGCWIELGATLASGNKVWLVDSKRDSVFWQHPHVRKVPYEELNVALGIVKEVPCAA